MPVGVQEGPIGACRALVARQQSNLPNLEFVISPRERRRAQAERAAHSTSFSRETSLASVQHNTTRLARRIVRLAGGPYHLSDSRRLEAGHFAPTATLAKPTTNGAQPNLPPSISTSASFFLQLLPPSQYADGRGSLECASSGEIGGGKV